MRRAGTRSAVRRPHRRRHMMITPAVSVRSLGGRVRRPSSRSRSPNPQVARTARTGRRRDHGRVRPRAARRDPRADSRAGTPEPIDLGEYAFMIPTRRVGPKRARPTKRSCRLDQRGETPRPPVWPSRSRLDDDRDVLLVLRRPVRRRRRVGRNASPGRWTAPAIVTENVPRAGAPSLAVTVCFDSTVPPRRSSTTSVASNTLAVPLTVNVFGTSPPAAGCSTMITGSNEATSARVRPVRPATSTCCTLGNWVSV